VSIQKYVRFRMPESGPNMPSVYIMAYFKVGNNCNGTGIVS
jgi:hypothetical protein